jgi:hypothetical protein
MAQSILATVEDHTTAMRTDSDNPAIITPSNNTIHSNSEVLSCNNEDEGSRLVSYQPVKHSKYISQTTQEGSQPQEIPIATPVPLPYTARSKAVLRSMISSGLVEGTQRHSSRENCSNETHHIRYRIIYKLGGATIASRCCSRTRSIGE